MAPPSPVFEFLFDIFTLEILPKLDIKSLIRFKSVSKSFQTLISSPDFIRHHLLTTNNRLLIYPANLPANPDILLTSLDRIWSFDIHSVSPAPPASFKFPTGIGTLVGSCNGLLLISRNPFVILNPSTRSYLNLPFFLDDDSIIFTRFIGFGFDDVNQDYKIVVISDYNRGPKYYKKTRVTSVYSVNSMSCKIVDQRSPQDWMSGVLSGVLVNNRFLHFRFWSTPKLEDRIGCFDVCTEEWKDDVLLPHYYYDPTRNYTFLDYGVLDDQLTSSFKNKVDNCVDLWVMKEYGVQESWIKLVSLPISKKIDGEGGIVAIASGGVDSRGVLILHRSRRNMFWYNRVHHTIHDLLFPGYSPYQVFIGKASLVALPGGKEFGQVYTHPIHSGTSTS